MSGLQQPLLIDHPTHEPPTIRSPKKPALPPALSLFLLKEAAYFNARLNTQGTFNDSPFFTGCCSDLEQGLSQLKENVSLASALRTSSRSMKKAVDSQTALILNGAPVTFGDLFKSGNASLKPILKTQAQINEATRSVRTALSHHRSLKNKAHFIIIGACFALFSFLLYHTACMAFLPAPAQELYESAVSAISCFNQTIFIGTGEWGGDNSELFCFVPFNELKTAYCEAPACADQSDWPCERFLKLANPDLFCDGIPAAQRAIGFTGLIFSSMALLATFLTGCARTCLGRNIPKNAQKMDDLAFLNAIATTDRRQQGSLPRQVREFITARKQHPQKMEPLRTALAIFSQRPEAQAGAAAGTSGSESKTEALPV